MPTTDRLQTVIEVGMIVNVPCRVTAVTQTPTPLVTMACILPDVGGTAGDVVGPLEAVQVIVQT